MRIDDLRPYIYRTVDRGKTWQSIAGALPPDAPVNAVREDPQRKALLFAATETAVWVSPDEGQHWDSLQLNLPHTSMRDLWIHGDDLIVATHGRSIWILDDISRLRQLPTAPRHEVVLLRPAAAYRLHRSTWSDTPLPPDEPLSSNPPAGAVIEFFLPHDARGAVILEVFDGNRVLVRRFRSDDPAEPDAEELARELIPRYWVKPPRVLPAQAGMHRWVWDLRYAAPLSATRGYPISAVPHATPKGPQGPLALPGSYLVRLTVEGRHFEAPLTVKVDPRVRLANGALEEQLRVTAELAGMLSESSRALLAARSEQAQLKALASAGATAQAVHAYESRLAELLGSADQKADDEQEKHGEPKILLPALQERIAALYTEVSRGDAAPTAAQLNATATARAALTGLASAWQHLQADLAALNARLRTAKLAAIRAELPPPRDLNAADED